jgi:hypothetical protein
LARLKLPHSKAGERLVSALQESKDGAIEACGRFTPTNRAHEVMVLGPLEAPTILMCEPPR